MKDPVHAIGVAALIILGIVLALGVFAATMNA